MQRRRVVGAGLALALAPWSVDAATRSAVDAPVVRMPLAKGVTPEDCVQSMDLRANLLNMKKVGDLPLSKQVEEMTGKPQRLIRVFLFCDPLTAMQMVGDSIDFAAYLPCRITLVEDAHSKYWLVMMNLKPLIDSVPKGSPLRAQAERVGGILQSIMHAGANGSL